VVSVLAAGPLMGAIPGADLVKLSWSKGMGYGLASRTELFVSGDGQKWRGLGLSEGEVLTGLCAGGDFFLAGCESGALYRVTGSGAGVKVEKLPAPKDPYGRVVRGLTTLAAGKGREVLASSGQGLMASKDGGTTWTAVVEPFWKVPEAREVVCVGYAGETAVVVTKRGAWRRGKAGYEAFGQGLPKNFVPMLGAAERGRVLVSSAAESLVETADGQSWTLAGLPAESPAAFIGWSGGGYLTAGPFSPVYEGKAGSWKKAGEASPGYVPVSSVSTGAGALVALRGKGLYRLEKGALAAVELPSEQAVVNARLEEGDATLVGTQGGIYRQEGKEAGWRDVTPASLGGAVSCFLRLGGGRLLAGALGSGVFLSEDGGKSWTDWNEELGTSNTVTALVLEGKSVLAATENGVMTRSLDGLWMRAEGSPYAAVNDLAQGGGRVWAATDAGLYSAAGGGALAAVVEVGGKVASLGAEGERLAAVADGRVLLRAGSGAWETLPALPGPPAQSVALSAGGGVWASSSAGVFRLSGGAWEKAKDRLPPVVKVVAEGAGVRVVAPTAGVRYAEGSRP
jgi:hypothetical protein